jgi:acetyl-CoA carboxylase biotin carboxyl carrier protein
MTTKPKIPVQAAVASPAVRSKINFDEVTKLLGLVDEKKLTHFELETEGFKIIIGRHPATPVPYVVNPAPTEHPLAPAARVPRDAPAPDYAREEEDASAAEAKGELQYITSPMVGTFYRTPDPSSPPFVDVGETVKKKQTLCIIEAMKLMNEIECDVEGLVKEIYVENGKPVEYGQRLFGIQLLG